MALTPQQQAEITRLRGVNVNPAYQSAGSMFRTQGDWDGYIAQRLRDFEKSNASRASHDRLVNFGRIASVAPFALAFAPGGALAAGGSGAAPAAVSHGYTSPGIYGGVSFGAPAAGSAAGNAGAGAGMASWASKVPWMQVGAKGVDTLFGIYANNQQSKATREALMAQQRASEQAMAFDREMENQRHADFLAQQAALQKQWEAEQAFDKSKWDATEEDRLYRRRLDEEKEARRAPFRAAGAAALARIPEIIAAGSVSPGLASLGSYRRG